MCCCCRYGLLGLLHVIRMTEPDLTMLALGTDLTGLGLNLNAPDSLYKVSHFCVVDTVVDTVLIAIGIGAQPECARQLVQGEFSVIQGFSALLLGLLIGFRVALGTDLTGSGINLIAPDSLYKVSVTGYG
jgi:hypothetical protein